jgi:hypothetical protein
LARFKVELLDPGKGPTTINEYLQKFSLQFVFWVITTRESSSCDRGSNKSMLEAGTHMRRNRD